MREKKKKKKITDPRCSASEEKPERDGVKAPDEFLAWSPVQRFVRTGCYNVPERVILDGAPLSELSWSSSLAVVAVSFSGLFTFVFLMLACLCCKKGKIGFKEFKNVDGEEYHADMSTLASPASQGSPDVYILPLTEVSLPVAKQPARSGGAPNETPAAVMSVRALARTGAPVPRIPTLMQLFSGAVLLCKD
ncbi:hypothetical protein INR49_003257 [Caranx melampygus]|nr:hypothetical protein INR49_003257 [Caranx melampygus]